MRQARKQKQLIKQKQKMYVNNWNVAQGLKFYDALDDQYATYYFANPTVKKHLKHFTKVVKKEPKTVDLLRMTFLLENKYKKKNDNLEQLEKSRQNQSINDSIIQTYKQGLKPKSLQKLKKINKYQLQPQSQNNSIDKKFGRAQSYQQGLPKVKNTRIYRSKDEENKVASLRKKDYLQYLQEKKEQIQKKQ